MVAKKSAPRRQRAAPAPSGPKKKQTVAAKKKHVRELVKASRWAEIERLYGKKILVKAKNYAQKSGALKTPQEIAQEILQKNGYLPSTSRQAPNVPASTEHRSIGSITRVNVPPRDTAESHNSPEMLTTEQQELIERRRHEALERRKRTQRVNDVTCVQPTVVPMDRVGNTTQMFEGNRLSAFRSVPAIHRQVQPQLQSMESSGQRVQMYNQPRRVVTPENLPVVEAEHVRPEYFWDDLEAAAEIVQWENEHMAEAVLKPPSTKTSGDPRKEASTVQVISGHQLTQSLGELSISQELAAAAEIIQWENEHEASSSIVSASRSGNAHDDPELEASQFQLLAVDTTTDDENQRQRQNYAAKSHPSSNQLQPKIQSHLKRQLVAAPPPALPRNTTDFNKATNPSTGNQLQPPSSCPAQNLRDPTAEFIDKHILENKLELPVLEFLDMMLS